MTYELIHDTIAKQVFEKASTEARTRRKVERYIHERYQAYLDRKAPLSQDDIEFIWPHLSTVRISNKEEAFIHKGKNLLERDRRRRRLLAIAAMAILLIFSISSFSLWRNAEKQKQLAEQKTIEALNSDSLAQMRAQEADRQRLIAELNADTARMARQEAVESALISDQQRAKAISAEGKTKAAFREVRSLYFASESKKALETRDYTRALNLAWASYNNNVNKESCDALLASAQIRGIVPYYQEYFPHGLSYASHVGFSKSNEYFYVFDDNDHTIAVWQNEPKKLLYKKGVKGYCKNSTVMEDLPGIGFSPDGKKIIAFNYSNGKAMAWTVANGKAADISRWSSTALYALVFSQDIIQQDSDYLLLFGMSDRMNIIRWSKILEETQHETEFLERTLFLEPGGYVENSLSLEEGDDYEQAAFSPDGQYVVMTNWEDEVVRFSLKTSQQVGNRVFTAYNVSKIRYSSDGQNIIALTNSGDVLRWDSNLQQQLDSAQYEYPDFLSPSARYLVEIERGGFLRFWKPEPKWTQDIKKDASHKGAMKEAVVSPQSNYIAHRSNGQLWLQSLKNSDIVHQLQNRVIDTEYSFTFSNNERYLILHSTPENRTSEVFLYRVSNGQLLKKWDATAACFSASSSSVFICTTEGDIQQFYISNLNKIHPFVHLGYTVEKLSMSPKGTYLVSHGTSGSKRAAIWSIKNKKINTNLWMDGDNFAFSSDEKLLFVKAYRIFSGESYLNTYQMSDGKKTIGFEKPETYTSGSTYAIQMVNFGKRPFLMTDHGIWDIETGFQVEAFAWQGRKDNELIAVDPQGKFVLYREGKQIIEKRSSIPNLIAGDIYFNQNPE